MNGFSIERINGLFYSNPFSTTASAGSLIPSSQRQHVSYIPEKKRRVLQQPRSSWSQVHEKEGWNFVPHQKYREVRYRRFSHVLECQVQLSHKSAEKASSDPQNSELCSCEKGTGWSRRLSLNHRDSDCCRCVRSHATFSGELTSRAL